MRWERIFVREEQQKGKELQVEAKQALLGHNMRSDWEDGEVMEGEKKGRGRKR